MSGSWEMVSKVIGEGNAKKLCALTDRDGRLIVPLRYDPGHRIARKIGIEAFVKLIDKFAGRRFVLRSPQNQNRNILYRNHIIANHNLLGMSRREVAELFNLNEKYVMQIEAASNDKNYSLSDDKA